MSEKVVLINESILAETAEAIKIKEGSMNTIKPINFAEKIISLQGTDIETCTVSFSAHYGDYNKPEEILKRVIYTASTENGIEIKDLNYSTSGTYTYNDVVKNSLCWVTLDNGDETLITGNINTILSRNYANVIGSSENTYLLLAQINGDGSIKIRTTCFLRGTQISLCNNSTKSVESITYDDKLLVWDFDNAQYAAAKPLWIKKMQVTSEYYDCYFSDGTNLKLVGGRGHAHRLFCVDTNRFEYANDCVGKIVMSQNGPVKMESCEIKQEEVEFYNIITDYHMNLYANGILSSTGLSNIYPIEDMKYVIEKRELIPIEAFDNCSEKYYYGLRLGEQKEYTLERLNEKLKEIQFLAIENGK